MIAIVVVIVIFLVVFASVIMYYTYDATGVLVGLFTNYDYDQLKITPLNNLFQYDDMYRQIDASFQQLQNELELNSKPSNPLNYLQLYKQHTYMDQYYSILAKTMNIDPRYLTIMTMFQLSTGKINPNRSLWKQVADDTLNKLQTRLTDLFSRLNKVDNISASGERYVFRYIMQKYLTNQIASTNRALNTLTIIQQIGKLPFEFVDNPFIINHRQEIMLKDLEEYINLRNATESKTLIDKLNEDVYQQALSVTEKDKLMNLNTVFLTKIKPSQAHLAEILSSLAKGSISAVRAGLVKYDNNPNLHYITQEQTDLVNELRISLPDILEMMKLMDNVNTRAKELIDKKLELNDIWTMIRTIEDQTRFKRLLYIPFPSMKEYVHTRAIVIMQRQSIEQINGVISLASTDYEAMRDAMFELSIGGLIFFAPDVNKRNLYDVYGDALIKKLKIKRVD